ncbi:PTS sugar transporter subunit IIB [Endozoicomonas ascidiicola]|uniref:PTS sugar transporter subunit IIB n=1 Tax=Endozoicomonas ascidiicola TaxID=1698521 RepID=UPI0008379E71|nr:PTS sugar transporter subunit IIB [Endozoicomonas ascidiicola]
MIKIALCCSAGMSTSMLVKKMQQSAQEKGIEAEINAYPISDFDDVIEQNDVCLLGPQVRFKLAEFQEKAKSYGKPVDSIDPMQYGMMQGDKVLDAAINLIS